MDDESNEYTSKFGNYLGIKDPAAVISLLS